MVVVFGIIPIQTINQDNKCNSPESTATRVCVWGGGWGMGGGSTNKIQCYSIIMLMIPTI